MNYSLGLNCKSSHERHDHNLFLEKNEPNYFGWFVAGGAAVVLMTAAALTAAYMLSPAVHNLFNHTFSSINMKEGILFLALPSTVAGVVSGIFIHLRKQHVIRNDKIGYQGDGVIQEVKKTMKEFFKAVTPSRKQFFVSLIAIGVISALGLSLGLIYHYVPAVNHWVQAKAISGMQNFLHHKIAFWKSLVGFGGVAFITSLISTFIVLHILHKRAENRAQLDGAALSEEERIKQGDDQLNRLLEESLASMERKK